MDIQIKEIPFIIQNEKKRPENIAKTEEKKSIVDQISKIYLEAEVYSYSSFSTCTMRNIVEKA